MQSETLVGLVLRLLPSIGVFVLAFLAMADKKTRERWNDLLFQIGSIRSDQREDVKIGRNVKWPFILVAVALLLWPIQFYRHATKTIDASASDLQKAPTVTSDLISSTDNSATDNSATGNSVSNEVSNSATPQSDLRPAVPATPNSAAPQSDLVPLPR